MKINIGAGVPLSPQEVEEAPIFKDWADRLDADWDGEVTIDAADIWGSPAVVHMLHMTVARPGSRWPARVTLRSETVDILVIVTDGTERWVVFVEQEREAAGCRVVSNVAGGIEDPETMAEAADHELWEELGLNDTKIRFRVKVSALIPEPVLASPGILNERVYMLQAVISVAPRHLKAFLKELHGKKTGLKSEGENLTLIVQPANKARDFIVNQPAPDAKTLLSLALTLP